MDYVAPKSTSLTEIYKLKLSKILLAQILLVHLYASFAIWAGKSGEEGAAGRGTEGSQIGDPPFQINGQNATISPLAPKMSAPENIPRNPIDPHPSWLHLYLTTLQQTICVFVSKTVIIQGGNDQNQAQISQKTTAMAQISHFPGFLAHFFLLSQSFLFITVVFYISRLFQVVSELQETKLKLLKNFSNFSQITQMPPELIKITNKYLRQSFENNPYRVNMGTNPINHAFSLISGENVQVFGKNNENCHELAGI